MPAGKRVAAAAALALGSAAVVVALVSAVRNFPRGGIVLACIVAALGIAVHAITRRTVRRAAWLALAMLLLAAALVLLLGRDPWLVVVSVVVAALSVTAARTAFRARVEWPAAPAPRRAVLFYNPRSGGGKAERFRLADEARARGIRPVALRPGDDLETLVRAEVAAGADALAMAGGDGSQAIVAAIVAETGLPYACIPAGTRNHFALDLGVDRDDVVGALDALVDGGERTVDLAEVNGRVFVNNVSLGLYATAVQREGYRGAKIRTMLETVPDMVEQGGNGARLVWRGPDGAEHGGGVVMLVSNNRYRLGTAVGSGTRPRLDDGELGIVVLGRDAGARRGWDEWTAPSVEVASDGDASVPAGVDGEAVLLEPPLRFAVRPHALRVRVARTHPGASPSALRPAGAGSGVAALARIALGQAQPA